MVGSSITALISHLWYSVDVFFVQSSLHTPKASVGLLWTISGVGGLVGSLVILSLGKRRRQEAILLTGLFLRGTSLIWYAMMTSYAWAVPAAFLAGWGDTWISVALFSLLMERTKHGMMGRVTAFQETASALTTFLALVMVGFLKSSVSPWQFLLFCGLALCGVGMSTTLGLRGARLS
jgi:predicted MFS family arabinose efflux permease